MIGALRTSSRRMPFAFQMFAKSQPVRCNLVYNRSGVYLVLPTLWSRLIVKATRFISRDRIPFGQRAILSAFLLGGHHCRQVIGLSDSPRMCCYVPGCEISICKPTCKTRACSRIMQDVIGCGIGNTRKRMPLLCARALLTHVLLGVRVNVDDNGKRQVSEKMKSVTRNLGPRISYRSLSCSPNFS